jgi:outer membrane protein TolC
MRQTEKRKNFSSFFHGPIHPQRFELFLLNLPGQAQAPAPEQRTISLEELQQMASQNNPTFAQATANIRAAEGRKQQSGLYPNPTVGYQGEEIRGGSFRGGEQGCFVQQNIVTAGKLGLNRNIFEQERKQADTEADEQKLRVVTNVLHPSACRAANAGTAKESEQIGTGRG